MINTGFSMSSADPIRARLIIESSFAKGEIQFLKQPISTNEIQFTSERRIIIGRSSKATDLQVHNLSVNSSISRVHCSIYYNERLQAFMITDLSSSNGTFVDDQRLPPEESTQLLDGDRIRLGALNHRGIEFTFRSSTAQRKGETERLVLRLSDDLSRTEPMTPISFPPPNPEDAKRSTSATVDVSNLMDMDELLEEFDEAGSPSLGSGAHGQTVPVSYAHEVFVSYSHLDTNQMKLISKYLTKQHNIKLWSDEKLTPGSDFWQSTIQTAIEDSKCLLVLLSPNAKQSIWVQREISYATLYDKKLFPVLIKGDAKESITLVTTTAHYIDLRGSRLRRGLPELANAIKLYLNTFE